MRLVSQGDPFLSSLVLLFENMQASLYQPFAIIACIVSVSDRDGPTLLVMLQVTFKSLVSWLG